MRYLKMVLTTTLLTVGLAHSEEPLQLRYQDGFGPMTLTITQNIEVKQPIASREMSFDVTLATDLKAASASLVIESAKASYSAHGMVQRLATRHLTGSTIPLAILEDGRQLREIEPADTPVIDMGPPVSGGFSVAGMLIGVLPHLPDQPISVGTSWSTERSVRSLEGWAWGVGKLKSRHRVTSIDSRHGRTIVTVETEAEGMLQSRDGDRAYSGELKRSLHWTFDATGGRVLSMSMEQETDGLSTLPQGEFVVRQRTEVELAPAA